MCVCYICGGICDDGGEIGCNDMMIYDVLVIDIMVCMMILWCICLWCIW